MGKNGLAARSPWFHAARHTFPFSIRIAGPYRAATPWQSMPSLLARSKSIGHSYGFNPNKLLDSRFSALHTLDAKNACIRPMPRIRRAGLPGNNLTYECSTTEAKMYVERPGRYRDAELRGKADTLLSSYVQCRRAMFRCPTSQRVDAECGSPRGWIYFIKQLLENNGSSTASSLQIHLPTSFKDPAFVTNCRASLGHVSIAAVSRRLTSTPLKRLTNRSLNFPQALLFSRLSTRRESLEDPINRRASNQKSISGVYSLYGRQ